MLAMYEVEFSPLLRGHWAEKGMIGQRNARPEARVTLGDYVVHPREVFKNFRGELLNGSAARKNAVR